MTDTERLLTLVAGALQVSRDAVTPSLASAELEEWDSLAHLRVLMLVEEEFEIRVEMEVAGQLDSVSEILDYIRQNRSA